MTDLPDYHFRIRENGAVVFRLDAQNRNRRLELDQIAVINIRNGEIRPHGDQRLADADLAAIRDWMTERVAYLARREADEIERLAEQLGLAAQWAQAKATDAELGAVTDRLLLCMHDLRSVLVRRQAERMDRDG